MQFHLNKNNLSYMGPNWNSNYSIHITTYQTGHVYSQLNLKIFGLGRLKRFGWYSYNRIDLIDFEATVNQILVRVIALEF